jgi:hypothetical protein
MSTSNTETLPAAPAGARLITDLPHYPSVKP